MVKQFRRYVYSFWHDPQTWQTGRQTDRHRMMARVIIIGWPIIAYHTWADDRDDHVGVINNIQWRVARACISGQFFMMQAIKAASKINCPKNHSDPLFGRPLKILPPNVEKPTYGTELYHHANFANWREISVPRQKYIFFRIRNSLGATVRCYTFLESSCRADFKL